MLVCVIRQLLEALIHGRFFGWQMMIKQESLYQTVLYNINTKVSVEPWRLPHVHSDVLQVDRHSENSVRTPLGATLDCLITLQHASPTYKGEVSGAVKLSPSFPTPFGVHW